MQDLHSDIKVENAVLEYNGKRIPLLSGEFHYWRVSPENWGVIADRILALGLNMVATYIPWNYHEIREGEFDFTGATNASRNLDGFLSLMKQKGLYVMVRPGPYIYAEWPCGGPPKRASGFSRLDPRFLEMAKVYIQAVTKVIVPHQITRGGSVILCQADNETFPELERCAGDCGALERDGAFKDFLRRRYNNDVERLNRAWHTQYSSFAEPCIFFHETIVDTANPMGEVLLPEASCKIRYYDTMLFIGDYAAQLVRRVGTWLRDAGIDVPITANGWSPLYQNFKAMTDVVDLCGSDIYPGEFLKKSYSGIHDHWRYNVDIIKQQAADSSHGNAWSAEFQSGSLAGTVLTEQAAHHRYIALFAMANGLKGLNYYMLVNRDNWNDAPINEWGRTNANYEKTKEAIALYRQVEPWNCIIRNDFALFVSKAHRNVEPGNYESMFRTLKTSPFTYCYFNPESSDRPRESVMVYCGAEWLLRSTGEKLRRYVQEGGTLIAFNRFPQVDECGEPLHLGFELPDAVRPVLLPVRLSADQWKSSMKLAHRGHADCKVNMFHYRRLPDGAGPLSASLSEKSAELLILIENRSGEVFHFGFIRPMGKGRVIQIGCAPDGEILKMVLDSIGHPPVADYCNPWLDIALFEHQSGRRFLSVLNRSECAQSTVVRLPAGFGKNLRHLEKNLLVSTINDEFRIDVPALDVEFYELA